jgi:hypothetical protein
MLYFYFFLLSTPAIASTNLPINNRIALVTAPAQLMPRQESTCPATATLCPDGNGCCESGYACTIVTGDPRCDKPCGFGYTTCAGGGCCEPGNRCGANGLCISTGPAFTVPNLSLPAPTAPLRPRETLQTPETPQPTEINPRPLSTTAGATGGGTAYGNQLNTMTELFGVLLGFLGILLPF